MNSGGLVCVNCQQKVMHLFEYKLLKFSLLLTNPITLHWSLDKTSSLFQFSTTPFLKLGNKPHSIPNGQPSKSLSHYIIGMHLVNTQRLFSYGFLDD